MALLSRNSQSLGQDVHVKASGDIYNEEFRKYLQAQKRFREVWLEFDAPWNHDLFQYANEDFYFYRFNINRIERNTAALLRDIIFRLLDLYQVDWSEGIAPILFKCQASDGSAIGYTFDDFYEDEDIVEICKENGVDKACVIRTWKSNRAENWVTRENSQYESHQLPVYAINISRFFIEQFGISEFQRFEEHLSTFLEEIYNLVGYRSIKFLSSMNLSMQKLVLEKKLLKYAGNRMGYTIIDRNKPEVQKYLYVDGYSFPMNIETAIQTNFVTTGLYKALLGTAEFAESFVTSEWLFHSLEGTEHFDYTAIISGYLKSIEQLLLQIVYANAGNNCKITLSNSKKDDAINANIKRYTWYKGGFRPIINGQSFKVEYIDVTATQLDYMDSDLGTYEYFLRNNPHIFHSQLQQMASINAKTYCDIVADIVGCFRAECRNGYFHTHNLKTWDTVIKIRENALMIYTLLLGGCVLPIPKCGGLQISQHDWFDALCIKIQNNRRATLDYTFEYSDGRNECVVFDFRNNTKEYTDSGMEHYESLRFYCVPDFSFDSYEKLDAGFYDKCMIYLTRSSVPQKIYSVNRKNLKTLLYENSM